MYMKPAEPIALEKGKALSSVDGFVDFWNWLAAFVFNLSAQNGVELDTTVQDKPILKGDMATKILEGSGVHIDEYEDGSIRISTVYV